MSAPALQARFKTRLQGKGRRFELDAQLSIERGVLALYGPSGSGKSTVLRVLAGLLRPGSGRISLGPHTLFDSSSGVSEPAHRRQVGYVPQQASLLPFHDVWGNVVFGLDRPRRRRDNPEVLELLEELGIAGLAAAGPDSLSGGEAQKVSLARALVTAPRLLLLDEPFSSVDHGSREALLATLSEILGRRSTPAIVVSHDPAEVRALADEVLLIEDGRTHGQGPTSQLDGAET